MAPCVSECGRLTARDSESRVGSTHPHTEDHWSGAVRMRQILIAHLLMMGWRVVLGEVICQVSLSWFPVYSELALLYSIFDPIELHVHGFRLLGFDCVVDDSCGHCVVGLDGRWALLFEARVF